MEGQGLKHCLVLLLSFQHLCRTGSSLQDTKKEQPATSIELRIARNLNEVKERGLEHCLAVLLSPSLLNTAAAYSKAFNVKVCM